MFRTPRSIDWDSMFENHFLLLKAHMLFKGSVDLPFSTGHLITQAHGNKNDVFSVYMLCSISLKFIELLERCTQNAVNEVRILASINNPKIVAYKEAFFEDVSTSLCLVMEFADDGDLYQKILKH